MPEQAPNKLSLTERIGKYEIVGHIATGGMGIVYLARDVELDRLVALKILPPELAGKPMVLVRFKREARAAAQLHHENIVNVFDVGEANGTHYIALEYIEGTDLQEYINRKCRLVATEARQLMIQAARALVHAHEQHIVHRDIKPSNFLLMHVDKRLIVKLTDFGLAIRDEDSAEFRVTRDRMTVGTVDYMSPEQARDSRLVDIRSDIYSLGCTFYHMLTGTAPFAHGTLPERLVQHMQKAPPDVRKLNKSVPPYMAAIINRMLSKQPEARYQTPSELLDHLEHPERVPLAGKRGLAKGGRTRKNADDLTAVIDSKLLDKASQSPAPGKASGVRRSTNDDDLDEEPSHDESDSETEFEGTEYDGPMPNSFVKKKALSKVPAWIIVVAGIVGVSVLFLALVWVIGGRTTPIKVDPPRPGPGPILVESPIRVQNPPPPIVDTSPANMRPGELILPGMPGQRANVDLTALRAEFSGPFEQFPTMASAAKPIRVRRMAAAGTEFCPELADALAQTKPDQVNLVEISEEGPIYLSALPDLSRRTLFLRAAAGHRPMLVWDIPPQVSSGKPTSLLKIANGKLILENLDLVLKGSGAGDLTLFDMPESDFYARDCTFSIAGKTSLGVAVVRRARESATAPVPATTKTWFKRCHVRGPDAVLLRLDRASTDLLVEESLIVGNEQALLSVMATHDECVRLYSIRSTLVAGQTLMRWRSPDPTPSSPRFEAHVLDSVLSRHDAAAPLGDMVQFPDAADLGRISWHACNSVYAGWKQLLSSKAKTLDQLTTWHREWLYDVGDRFELECWPASVPPTLEDHAADTFVTAQSSLGFAALSGKGAIGCVIGWLPRAPVGWRERTVARMNVAAWPGVDESVPRIETASDGLYHGERLDVSKLDFGAYLTNQLEKSKPAPRVVIHVTGKGTFLTSPLRVKGVQHLVLHFDMKDTPTLEPNAVNFLQHPSLIDMTGGHLELMGARLRLNAGTPAAGAIQIHDAHLTLTRCWLQGPLSRAEESFQRLVGISGSGPEPATLQLRDSTLVSGKLLVQLQENVQLRARNNVLVSLGGGVQIACATSIGSIVHQFDHNTLVARKTFVNVQAATGSLPREMVLLDASSNAFLYPFPEDGEKATLLSGADSWILNGRLRWQGRYNVYDARLYSYYASATEKFGAAKQSLKDWQRLWGYVGEQEAQLLDASLATKVLTLDPKAPPDMPLPLERLVLPRTIRFDLLQGPPGADLTALGILKKKG